MAMTIQLIKRRGKPALLSCTRIDASNTMAEIIVGPEHDLAHHAVETTLGLRDSFYALLERGTDIQAFGVSAATTKIDIPPEAAFTEHVVCLLQMERRNDRAYTPEEFRAELARMMDGSRRPIPEERRPPPPTDDQLAAIRAMLDELMGLWIATPAGESLTLTFPPS